GDAKINIGPPETATTKPAELGRRLCVRIWQEQPLNTQIGDGLGPLYNAQSCAACHKQGGVDGGGPSENNVQLINTVAAMQHDRRIGRFGWKGQTATLAEFNGNACAVELGLTTATFQQAKAPFFPRNPESPVSSDVGPKKVDVMPGDVAALTAFVAALPRP